MTPERWQQIETLYHAARERQASERAAFLAEACADAAGLRAEVEALLRADEVSHGIIDGNALEEAARLHPTTDPLQLGQQLGAYKILALLGKGGMGEVYRARDTRLEREVAIKVLPADFAQDAERLRRFEQEARATSALNHPNILTIYDLGQHEGAPFLVAELLEGEELRAQLSPQAKAGPLPLKRAIEYAQQIAAGLAAAHAKGIIHRDLKPENIFVTSDGRVKILDFGLAKLATPPKDSVRPDVATQRHLTMPGTVLGTVAYMSPEQVRGEVVDQRSDIFSFGQILYEMLAGQRAFDGATLPDLMAAILKEEPPELSGINPQVPPSLEKIVLRCLEKKPEQRFQTASDLGFALETLANARTSDARRSPAAKASGLSLRWHGRPVWLLAASVLVLLTVWAGWRFASSRVAPLPPAKLSPFTSLPGNERQPSFSPDGNQLVFVWDGATGDNADLYVKQVGNETLVRLTNDPAADTVPSWSPDGRTIAFIRELADGAAALSLIPSLGGQERRLTAVMKYPGERAISWSPDGNWLALRDRNADNEAPGIFLVSRTTGEKRRLTTPPAGNAVSDNFPAFSPDGRMIVFERFFAALVNDLFQVPVTGGEPQRLTFDGTLIQSPVWSPDGHELLFISWREGGTPGLWRMPAAGGAPERVPLAVRKPVNLAMSPQGNRLALTEDVSDANIWRMELPDAASGRKEALQPPSALIASTMFDANPQYSPDGKRIAFMSNRAGGHEIWLADSNGERPVALTAFNRIGTGSVTWSPDGSQLVFDARPEGNAEIYAVNIADRKLRRLTNNVAEDANPVWSRDGQWVYFRSARSGERHLWKMPAAGGEAIPVMQQIGHDCLESPDGQWLYFTKGYRLPGIWRMPVNGGEATLVLNHHNAGGWRHWTVTEKGIYFATNQQPGQTLLEFFSFATRQITLLATVPKGLDATTPGLSVSPDGRWLIWSQLDQQGSDLLLLDNFR